jgi:Ca2+-binding RTX toxin-like protein
MKRLSIILAVMALALTMGAGVAYAANVQCDGGVCVGTPEDDEITGSQQRDEIFGLEGDDDIRARGGFDVVKADGGRDELRGGEQGDTLRGGAGRDIVIGGQGIDRMFGNANDDEIDAADNNRDGLIDGGPGFDVCIIDFVDRNETVDCERVQLG